MAKTTLRSEVAAIRSAQRAAVKGLRPTLRSTGVRLKRRRTAKIHIRG